MLAICGGKIYTMEDKIIDEGSILIDEGKIKSLSTKKDIDSTSDLSKIDATGKYVMPGFIDTHSHIGLFEEGIGEAGEDGNEWTCPVTPHIRAIDAINPADKAFDDAVKGGITTVFTGPGSANVISGQSLAMKTWGKVVDKMVVKSPAGVKIAFGENPKRVYGQQKKMPSTRMGIAALLRETLVKAQNYKKKREKAKEDPEKTFDIDLKMEILCDVLDKKLPFRAHAHRADDIITAIRIAKEFDVKIVIEHCTEGHLVAEELLEAEIPAVVGPTLSSRSKVELMDLSFKTPGILANKGIDVALMTDHPVIPIQYLPICAALAVKDGMKEKDALEAITIKAAKIIGIDDRVGSLKKGKDADIVIWDGHPFDIKSKPVCVIVDGKVVYKDK